jgi:hypothetical protein
MRQQFTEADTIRILVAIAFLDLHEIIIGRTKSKVKWKIKVTNRDSLIVKAIKNEFSANVG